MSHSSQREIDRRDRRGVTSGLFTPRARFAEVSRVVPCAVRACRSVLADRRGMSALELAVIALLIVPAIVAVVELGNAAQQQIQLQQALRVGGQYAMKYGCASPCSGSQAATNIINAVKASLPTNWTVTFPSSTPSSTCVCYSGDSCDTSCPTSQNVPVNFAQTSITLTASMQYTGTFLNTTINASYVVRSQ